MSTFPIFNVRDLEGAVAFYERLLEFEQTYRWPPEGELEYAYLRRGGDGIGLAPGDPGSGYLLCVYVEDVDATAAALRDAGATESEPPEDKPWGERMATYETPHGHRLLLTTRL